MIGKIAYLVKRDFDWDEDEEDEPWTFISENEYKQRYYYTDVKRIVYFEVENNE